MSNWIKVEEKLPELDELVIVYTREGEYKICVLIEEYGYKRFYNIHSEYREYATHWKKLTKPLEE